MKSILMLLQRILMLTPLIFLSFQVQAEDEEGMEKISVIGSHIKRTDMEGSSPVLIIDREQIELSGRHSVADVLRDLPSASLGGNDNAALSVFSPTYTSLRGMDISNILILLNGRHMATADLKMVPTAVVEKIEILKDGASAIYGSHAVGGVINIVTKRGDVGGQVNVSGSLVPRVEGNSLSALASYVDFYDWDTKGHPDPDERWSGKGDKLTVDAFYGGTEGDINYLVGGQIRLNSALYYRDREFGKAEVKHYSPRAYPGNWLVAGVHDQLQPFPNCAKENLKKPEDGGFCGFNFSRYMQVKPQMLQGSVFLQVDTELNTRTRLSSNVLYAYTRTHSILAPGADSFEQKTNFNTGATVDYRLSADTAQAIGLPVIGGESVNVYLRTVDFGKRQSILNDHFYQLQVDLVHDVGNTMEADINFNLSGIHQKSTGIAGYSQIDKFQSNADKLISATSDLSNISISEEKKELMDDIRYEPLSTVDAMVISVEPRLTGELAEIGNQPLSFAVGGLGGWGFFDQGVDDITAEGKQFGGGVPTIVNGDRFYGALYGELSALFGGMADLNIALRSDYYSDFGFPDQKIPFTDIGLPVTPSVKLSFQPVKQVKFRASWGQGFKAPSLDALHTKAVVTHYEGQDKVKECEGGKCPKQQEEIHLLGNLDLEPEYSQNVNLGIVLEPVNRVAFSFDLFQVNLTNIVTKWASSAEAETSFQAILDYEAEHGAEATEKKLGAEIIRHSPKGPIKQVKVKSQNGEDYTVQGFDLEASTVVPVNNAWNVGLSLMHTHLLYVKKYNNITKKTYCPVPYYDWMNDWIGGDDSCNKVREGTSSATWNGYPRWRNQLVLALMNKDKDYNIQLVVSNIPSQLERANDPSGFTDENGKVNKKAKEEAEKPIDYYWQVDLVGSFAISKKGKITGGIENILAVKPPVNKSTFGSSGYTNSTLYPLEGRTINVRYTHNF